MIIVHNQWSCKSLVGALRSNHEWEQRLHNFKTRTMAKHRNVFTIITDIIHRIKIANKFATTASQSGKWLTQIEKDININKSLNEPQWLWKRGTGWDSANYDELRTKENISNMRMHAINLIETSTWPGEAWLSLRFPSISLQPEVSRQQVPITTTGSGTNSLVLTRCLQKILIFMTHLSSTKHFNWGPQSTKLAERERARQRPSKCTP